MTTWTCFLAPAHHSSLEGMHLKGGISPVLLANWQDPTTGAVGHSVLSFLACLGGPAACVPVLPLGAQGEVQWRAVCRQGRQHSCAWCLHVTAVQTGLRPLTRTQLACFVICINSDILPPWPLIGSLSFSSPDRNSIAASQANANPTCSARWRNPIKTKSQLPAVKSTLSWHTWGILSRLLT